ncbi:integrase arm-type DNA-binding domain-containing protein [Nitratireductor mangrovi]|uniref:Integrase arm-type DNA-binding domain-containing protein n=1 Tax=Nitratireductor mangrovi TaxID=2599600 RepID=A0A5B8KV60_9HYPH|nr:integrase arm-type DNA-binding domain-containing protein [Nitratireductor mangrovi]QDY99451.1 integrase arm-type DNA-binding domain-containing protein [Nitratireductor mangrovi]
MALSDVQLRSLKPSSTTRKISDGGGLFVQVTPSGSKLWRLAYRYDGKQKLLAFGSYPAVSLADARTRRDNAKRLLASGIDPSSHAKAEKAARRAAVEDTFQAVADEFLGKVEREGKADATLKKKRWLIGLAAADIGRQPISDISAADVLAPLRRVEALGNYETARRLRAVVSQVFRYAIAISKATNDPTFGLRGALVAPKVTNRAALTDWPNFAGLLRAIWCYEGTVETRAALKLMALLYPRPGELRQAEWKEFDLNDATWTIPESRSKMRRPHCKPLPAPALEVLRGLKEHTGTRRLAFPSIQSPERPLSENTMNAALRRMGFSQTEATSHGFRATASTLLNESGMWSPDAIEAELGHVGADEVRRAYHRARYWEERVKMAEWWGAAILSNSRGRVIDAGKS